MPRASWPTYQTLEPLIHAHAGRAAVIMGGGPSLHEGVTRAPGDAVYLSANDHGVRYFKHRGLPQRCAYVVAGDENERRWRGDVRARADGVPVDGKPWGCPVIGRQMWADYRLLFMPQPNSGIAAAWVARVMGCAPIILLGMDLYAGGTYHDDAKYKSSGKSLSAGDHRLNWIKFLSAFPGPYRALGCERELRAMVGEFDAAERYRPGESRYQLLEGLRRDRCRLTADAVIMQRPFSAGLTLDLRKNEVDDLIKHGKAVRLRIVE